MEPKNSASSRWLLVCLCALVPTYLIAQAPGTSRIRWSVEDISETMAAGATKSVTLRVECTRDLPNVSLWLSPSLRELVTVKPAAFESLTANQPQEITLTIRIPPGAPAEEH